MGTGYGQDGQYNGPAPASGDDPGEGSVQASRISYWMQSQLASLWLKACMRTASR